MLYIMCTRQLDYWVQTEEVEGEKTLNLITLITIIRLLNCEAWAACIGVRAMLSVQSDCQFN